VNFIKRVVAGPADEIYIKEGHVLRGPPGEAAFTQETDSYFKPCPEGAAECNFPTPIRIPRRALVHAGRKPWRIRRQPVLGSVPTEWIACVVLK
jgi:hypothetical protein